jgi:hypothetical protein
VDPALATEERERRGWPYTGPPGGHFLLNLRRRSLADRDSLGVSLRGLCAAWSSGQQAPGRRAWPPLLLLLVLLLALPSSLLTYDSARAQYKAQPAGKVARIGILSPGSASGAGRNPTDLAVLFAAFREGLRELGYVEGQNIKIESRWAEGNYDRLPGLAADLVRLKVDVIVTYGTPASQAAKRATGTIPIVMAGIIDPVASGLVTSIARPGGNITGQSMMSPDLVASS